LTFHFALAIFTRVRHYGGIKIQVCCCKGSWPLPMKIRKTEPEATDRPIRALVLFCGGGGSSWGARQAGIEIVAAFDLWALAGEPHRANFPETEFVPGRLEELDVAELVEKFGPIDLIIASPDCTNHSPAKGKRPRCEQSKNTAFEVVRFAKA